MTRDGTIGDSRLSAWAVAPGVCWVQTRSPVYAKKLAKRRDSRLVVRGVTGGFLRTFEFQHSMAWAKRLLAHYVQAGEPPNEPFLSPASPLRSRNRHPGVIASLPPQKPLQRKTRPSQ